MFILLPWQASRSGIINKTSETKHLDGEQHKGVLGKQKRVRNLITKIDDGIQVIELPVMRTPPSKLMLLSMVSKSSII